MFKALWDKFVNSLEVYYNVTVYHKKCLIWGILNKKTDILPLGLIRRMCLELNDFKKFEKYDHSAILDSINIHYNDIVIFLLLCR